MPAAFILGWALVASWLAVNRGEDRWMVVVAVGDGLLALNLGMATLLIGEANSKIEFGETLTITGGVAVLLLVLVLVVPFTMSAVWAVRRIRLVSLTA